MKPREFNEAAVKAIPIPETGYTISRYGRAKLGGVVAPPGFAVRTTADGTKSFVLEYRISGRDRRYTFGKWPIWTAQRAIIRAVELRREIDLGKDPAEERKEAREAATVADLCDDYLKIHAVTKRSAGEDRAMIARYVRPRLGSLKVDTINESHIRALHRQITDAGYPIRANRVLSLLSKMFDLAAKWGMRTRDPGLNPARGIPRNDETKRERFATRQELARITAALAAHRNQASANVVRLLLLTGARRGEVLGARWDQFDAAAGIWTKPASGTKQRKVHRIPLSDPAKAVINAMWIEAGKRAQESGAKMSPYLFPSIDGKGSQASIKSFWRSIQSTAKVPDIRIHDLRHTFASYLVSSGLTLPVIGALLGHSQPATTARYAHLLDKPLRDATQIAATAMLGPAE